MKATLQANANWSNRFPKLLFCGALSLAWLYPASAICHTQSSRSQLPLQAGSKYEASNSSFRRPLNPPSRPQAAEAAVDRYFRLAYSAGRAGDFDTAVINYSKAATTATSTCDHQHAVAGEQAAQEAKAVLKKQGWLGKPTQFFWNRLQQLTKTLTCVTVR